MVKKSMDAFKELLEVAERLNGPDGCPWDVKQTFESLARYVLEEAHEVVDAVYNSDDEHILEELGDLFYTVIFYGKVAERQGRFTIDQIIEQLKNKLIRRHPHVFGDIKLEHDDDVVIHWERIKSQEKQKRAVKNLFDDLPKDLPILLRASKVIKRLRKHHPELLPSALTKDMGERFLQLVVEAQEAGIDPESAVREALARYEKMPKGSA